VGIPAKVLRVDLSKGISSVEPVTPDEQRLFVGGRGLNVYRLLREGVFARGPLEDSSLLVLGCGLLSGTSLPAVSRLEVSGRSPATGLLSTGNAGSPFASKLAALGMAQLIISGVSERPVVLVLAADKVTLMEADQLWGMDTHETAAAVERLFSGEHLSVACIGPAGERLVPMSTVIFDRYRSAGRGGLGAVMGAKRLKAVVVLGETVHSPDLTDEMGTRLITKIRQAPLFADPGSYAAIQGLEAGQRFGWLPTRNFTSGIWDGAASVGTQKFFQDYVRGGPLSACGFCVTPCDRRFEIGAGHFAGESGRGAKLESLLDFGARCDIRDLGAVLHLTNLCNKLGLDIISSSAAVAFTMECAQAGLLDASEASRKWGRLRFGDVSGTEELLHEIAFGHGWGAILGQGVDVACAHVGGEAKSGALAVKGLEITGVDPRACQGWGLAYAVSGRGGCHSRALAMVELGGLEDVAERIFGRPEWADPYGVQGKAEMVKWHEDFSALLDSVGLCKFPALDLYAVGPADIAEVLSALWCHEVSADDCLLIGERVVTLERLFNLRCGLNPQQDTLPERLLREPLPGGPGEGRVVDLSRMLAEYMKARGWDSITGVPERRTLDRLGIYSLGL
jgi:aldehyde:ferredoxin oxidoreductase